MRALQARSERRATTALALVAFAMLAALATLAGCYDVPKPVCGFRCGPEGACPEDYTCDQSDGRCHLNSAPGTLVCGTVDASIPLSDGPPEPLDAPPDAPPDAL